MNEIEREVLRGIKPSVEEEKRVHEAIERFRNELTGLKTEVGGSVARGTWLKDIVDVDIFVKFDPKKNKSDKISDPVEKVLKKKFENVERIRGSRDYFQVPYSGYTFEVVPVMDIKNSKEAQNTTDLSPLHVRWHNKRTDKNVKDEIRITKQFCKANGVYGAESYIKGFSGYVLELLLAYYKTFSRLSKAAHKWTDKTIIDIERHYTRNEVLARLNQSKIQSPLIVVDPTWPERNAAAALSKESFEGFKKACLEYVKKPSTKFFDMKKFDLKKELNRYNPKDCFVLEMTPSLSNRDIEGTKVLKIYEKIYRRLKDQGFEIRRSGWQFDEKAVVWFVVKNGKLSRNEKHYGPPKKLEKAIENFKKEWKGKKIGFENGRSYVVVERKYSDLISFAEDVIKEDFVKKRVKKVSLIKV